MDKINRDAGIPPWMQLRDILRAAIVSGELTGKLPSVRTLGQEQDGMAASTVVKALTALRREGLVEPLKGWGWRVIPPDERESSSGAPSGER